MYEYCIKFIKIKFNLEDKWVFLMWGVCKENKDWLVIWLWRKILGLLCVIVLNFFVFMFVKLL